MGNATCASLLHNIMPNDLNKILENSPECLSNDALRRYLEGDPEVQRTVERHLVDCELCNSAMEGFAAIPVFSSVPELNANIRKIATKGTGTNWIKYAATSLAGAAIVLSIFILKNEENTAQKNEVFTEETTKGIATEETVVRTKPLPITPDNFDHDPIVNETILEHTIAEQPRVTTDATEAVMIVRGPGPEKVVIRKTGPLTSPSKIDGRSKRPKVWSNVHIAYVHDLLIVDYSRIFTSGVNTVEERYGSLHPQFENQQDRTIIKFEPRTYNIPYLEFMEDAMSGFANGKPSKTLIDLEILLEQHNSDVNGLFYSGLCLYHMDRPDRAITFFDKAIGSSINTFYEEAKWYKALSLIRIGNKNDVTILLAEIVKEGGFYAERAQKKIDDLN